MASIGHEPDARVHHLQQAVLRSTDFTAFASCFGVFSQKKMEIANETVLKNKGGSTCCVPLCKSNSMKNPELSFHQFPRESSLKETWLNLLGLQKQP